MERQGHCCSSRARHSRTREAEGTERGEEDSRRVRVKSQTSWTPGGRRLDARDLGVLPQPESWALLLLFVLCHRPSPILPQFPISSTFGGAAIWGGGPTEIESLKVSAFLGAALLWQKGCPLPPAVCMFQVISRVRGRVWASLFSGGWGSGGWVRSSRWLAASPALVALTHCPNKNRESSFGKQHCERERAARATTRRIG